MQATHRNTGLDRCDVCLRPSPSPSSLIRRRPVPPSPPPPPPELSSPKAVFSGTPDICERDGETSPASQLRERMGNGAQMRSVMFSGTSFEGRVARSLVLHVRMLADTRPDAMSPRACSATRDGAFFVTELKASSNKLGGLECSTSGRGHRPLSRPHDLRRRT
ncbi:hypothetical protein BC628DRAFT_125893 [Trametes gibbosa]|nr:hypothetical protein BC628DRAFT_125893 [Trametes gibbosa]